MEAQVLENDGAVLAYLPEHELAMVGAGTYAEPARKTTVAERTEENLLPANVVPWGEENDFPQKLQLLAEESTVIGETLNKQVNFLYGRGLVPMLVMGLDKEGNEILEPATEDDYPQVWEFVHRSNLNRYVMEAAKDLYYANNIFPELILSKDRRQIVQLTAQEATECRWQVRKKGQAVPPVCHINGDWTQPERNSSEKVNTINPYDAYRWEMLREDRQWQYIYPCSYPSFGKHYYAYPQWYSAKKSGWLDVAQAIPKWKKALMHNQVSVRYLVKIPDYWWEWKYPNWRSLTAKEKKEKQQAEFKKAEQFLSGAENAGKALFTSFKYDQALQKEFPGWTIEEVGHKWKDGLYLEDSQEASAHLLYAMGFDPTLVGFSPGKNHTSAGSGSDKRVAYNMYMAGIHPKKDLLTEPIHFISQYNAKYSDWPAKLRWVFRYQAVTTLNEGKETKSEMG